MAIPVFAPTIGPSFGIARPNTYRSDVQTSHKGYEMMRPLGLRKISPINVTWQALKKPQLDEIISFFDSLNGSLGPFSYTPVDTVTGPEGITPALSQVVGGSLTSQPPYFVTFTWHQTTGTLETTKSKEATFTVDDNKLLTVTVPVFPLGVSEWRVYCGIVTGDTEIQAGTETTRTWTMPVGGRVAGGANPPTTNDLSVSRFFTFSGTLTDTLIAPGIYSLATTFNEQTAAVP